MTLERFASLTMSIGTPIMFIAVVLVSAISERRDRNRLVNQIQSLRHALVLEHLNRGDTALTNIPTFAKPSYVASNSYLVVSNCVTQPKLELEQDRQPFTVTNFVYNGLAAWAAETNHTFGPKMAKSVYIMQLPKDGKFHIRYRDPGDTNTEFKVLFASDTAFETAEHARGIWNYNISILTEKALCDAFEDAFKRTKDKP